MPPPLSLNRSLTAAAVLGTLLAVLPFQSWADAIEGVQVMSGSVRYPAEHPIRLYLMGMWTLLHQGGTLLHFVGLSPWALSLFYCALAGALGTTALTAFLFALGGNGWWALLGAVFTVENLGLYKTLVYSVDIFIAESTYGRIGVNWCLLALALVACGRYRAGGFMLTAAPAVHPTMALWIWLMAGLGFALDRQRLSDLWARARPWLIAGLVLTVASFALHLTLRPAAWPTTGDAERALWRNFILHWDKHRQPLPLSWATLYQPAAAVILAGLLYGRSRFLSAAIVISTVTLVAFLPIYAWVFSQLQAGAPLGPLAGLVIRAMPGRYFVPATLLCFPMLVALAGTVPFRSWLFPTSVWAIVIVRAAHYSPPLWFAGVTLVGLFAAWHLARSREQWQTNVRPALAGLFALSVTLTFYRYYVPRTWKGLADGSLSLGTPRGRAVTLPPGDGPLVVAPGLSRLFQGRTGRAVVLEVDSLDYVSYLPSLTGPVDRAAREAYGMGFDARPENHSGGLTAKPIRPIWESRTAEQWTAIAVKYGAVGVVAPEDWSLALPGRPIGSGVHFHALLATATAQSRPE